MEAGELSYRGTVEYRAAVGGGLIEHEVVDIYVSEMPEGFEPNPNPDEVMDTIWSPLSGLSEQISRNPSAFTPWLQIYLRDHAAEIFGESV